MKNISMVCFKLYDKKDLLFAEVIDFDPPEDERVIFFAAKARKILDRFRRENPGEKISRIEVTTTSQSSQVVTFFVSANGELQSAIAEKGDSEK